MKVVIDGRYLRRRASGIKTYTTALIDHFAGIAKYRFRGMGPPGHDPAHQSVE